MTDHQIIVLLLIAVIVWFAGVVAVGLIFRGRSPGKEAYGYEITRANGFKDATFGHAPLSAAELARLNCRIANGEKIRILYRPKRPTQTPEQLAEAFRSAKNYQDYMDGKL